MKRFRNLMFTALYLIILIFVPTQGSSQTVDTTMGKLFVETIPEDSRIRILNIKPKFHQGIKLKPGRYLIEVSAVGYEVKKRYCAIEAGQDRNMLFHLKKVHIASKEQLNKLFKAIEKNDYKLITKLVNDGIDVNAKDEKGDDPLCFAVRMSNDVEIVKFLIKKGAKVDERYFLNLTALAFASFIGKREMVKVLIENGSDVNAKDNLGKTVLINAVSRKGPCDENTFLTVELLLKNGAKVDSTDKDGNTALDWANDKVDCEKVVQLLRKYDGK